MAILVQGCTGHQEQQMPFPAFIEPEKRASSTDAEKPFIIELEHTILKLQSLSKDSVGKVPTFHLFLILFPHQHLTTCACHADHMMIL